MTSRLLPDTRVGPGPDRAWLSISDAARALGVSTSTLRAWAADGRVPHVRTAGGHRRFDPDDLAQWLAARPAPPVPRTAGTTRIAPCVGAAQVLEQRAADIAARAQPAHGVGSDDRGAARDWSLAAAHALRTGRMDPALDLAAARGRALGAAGASARAAMAGALAVERAVDDVLAHEPLPAADRDHVDALLRRMLVRMADAWAQARAGL